MDKKAEFMLKGQTYAIQQTPGKLQYYRAENEPFLPDSVKWAIRMPDRIAYRELALSYEEESQQQIIKYLNHQIKQDYLHGSRDINLDLTISEASTLYQASDKIKEMADSGELSQLH